MRDWKRPHEVLSDNASIAAKSDRNVSRLLQTLIPVVDHGRVGLTDLHRWEQRFRSRLLQLSGNRQAKGAELWITAIAQRQYGKGQVHIALEVIIGWPAIPCARSITLAAGAGY